MAEILYLNNEIEEIVGLPNGELVSATEYEQLNDYDYLEMTARVSPENVEILDRTNFMGIKRRGTANHFNIYKTINTQVGTEIFIKGVNLLYDELRGITLDAISWDNSNVFNILTDILRDSGWQLDYVTEGTPESVEYYNFDYTDLYTAFIDVVNYFKLEYTTFYDVESKKRVIRIEQFHNEEKPVFEYIHGINTKDIAKEVDTLDSYTAVVGLGKVINEETGERLKFTNVIWRKSEGAKLDKVGGQDYLEIPELTKKNSLFNGQPKKKFVIYEDVEDSTVLIERAYKDLVDIARPKVQYRATAISLGDIIKVGDQVVVKRTDLDIRYLTRIFRIKHNLLNENYSYAEFGDVTHTSMAKRLKNMPKPEFDTTIFDDEIQKLKKRVWDLENQAPENIRPKPLDDKYFTFSRNATGWTLTGLSELGRQAIESGEIEGAMNLPEHRDGLPFNSIATLRSFVFDGHIFVPYTYETLSEYGTFDGITVDYIEFEDNGTESGLKSMGQFAFRCEIRAGVIKLPSSLQTTVNTSFNTQSSRIDIPQHVYDRINKTIPHSKYVNIFDPYMVVEEGDFLIEEESKTVTIVGLSYKGAMKNNVVVPDKLKGKEVRNLLSNALRGYANPRIVDISQTKITALSPYVFAEMDSLQELIYPSNLTTIGEYAFYRTGIQRFTPVGVSLLTEVGRYAFSECTFEEFIMPDSFQNLGDSSFRNCKSLYNIQLSQNVIEISNNCFNGVSMLSEITFPPMLKSIGTDAFQGTALTSVKFPESLTSIGAGAFMRLPLTSVEFGLVRPVSIGSQAFRYIPLTEVVLKSGSSWDTNRYRPTFEPSTIITLV